MKEIDWEGEKSSIERGRGRGEMERERREREKKKRDCRRIMESDWERERKIESEESRNKVLLMIFDIALRFDVPNLQYWNTSTQQLRVIREERVLDENMDIVKEIDTE